MSKEKCYEDVRVYDFFDVMHYLEQTLLWENAHDDMFSMIYYSDQEGRNDSLHRVYRHWIEDKRLQGLFDVICEAFDIEHDIESYGDCTKIIFWVSW